MAISEKEPLATQGAVEEAQQPTQGSERVDAQVSAQEAPRHQKEEQAFLQAVGLLILVLGLNHLALIPGTVVDGQRIGWSGHLGDLPLLVTWPLGSLLVAYTVLCYVRASLRPVGLPFGPCNWMRPMVKGAVTSLITCALLWPGLEPNSLDFVVFPLISAAVLVAWLARRFAHRGPLADLQNPIGTTSLQGSWVKRTATRIGLGTATALAVLVLGIGNWFLVPAWTPPIVDAQGNHVQGSIASLETVRLGGADQSILIRGWNTQNPVLLVLPGGPGGSYMGEGPRVWGELEKYFTVVEWDPRGVTKSYGALNPTSNITVAQIVSDTIQLSEQLRIRFHQNKIYLLGHSGGSIYGVWAVQQRPDLYAAYIGGSQMVNLRLTDQSIYDKLLQHATQTGDQGLLQTLRAQGRPPYFGPSVLLSNPFNVSRMGDGLAMKYGNVIFTARDVFESPRSEESAAAKQALGSNPGGMFSPEFNLVDKINYFRGLNDVFTVLYPQIQDFDFRRDAPVLKVPVYFMLGQYDVNGTQLSVDYFHTLQAPLKRLYIFPKGSHGEIFTQPERFTSIMVNTVLRETQP
jgi:pimeloyl-ACP methyl ester carboxylesterase